MTNSKTFIAAIAAITLISAPAFADMIPTSETVTFEINLDASPAQIYSDIREQARDACGSERGSSSIVTRMNTRQTCQKRLVRDIVTVLRNQKLLDQVQTTDLETNQAPG